MISLSLFELVLSFLDEPSPVDRQVAMTMCISPLSGKNGPLQIFSLEEIHYEIATYRSGATFNSRDLDSLVARRVRRRFVEGVESYLGRPLSGFELDVVIVEAMRGTRTPAQVAALLQQKIGEKMALPLAPDL